MANVDSLNHSVICVHDIGTATEFYREVFDAKPHSRVNFQIEEVLSGLAVFQSVVIEDYLLALALVPDFMPMPPERQHRGAHGFRHGFSLPRRKFDDIQTALDKRGVAYEGPVEHPAAGPFGESIYFKDPSGNFMEVLWRRDEKPNAKKRRYVGAE